MYHFDDAIPVIHCFCSLPLYLWEESSKWVSFFPHTSQVVNMTHCLCVCVCERQRWRWRESEGEGKGEGEGETMSPASGWKQRRASVCLRCSFHSRSRSLIAERNHHESHPWPRPHLQPHQRVSSRPHVLHSPPRKPGAQMEGQPGDSLEEQGPAG